MKNMIVLYTRNIFNVYSIQNKFESHQETLKAILAYLYCVLQATRQFLSVVFTMVENVSCLKIFFIDFFWARNKPRTYSTASRVYVELFLNINMWWSDSVIARTESGLNRSLGTRRGTHSQWVGIHTPLLYDQNLVVMESPLTWFTTLLERDFLHSSWLKAN